MAGLRFLLSAAGHEIKQLAGYSALLDERLVPVDTLHAVALTQKGKSGTIAISFGTEFKDVTEVEIVTTNGTVVWGPTEVKSVAGKGGEKVEETKTFPYSSGVVAEVAAFAQGIEAGAIDAFQSPAEALKDVELIQRMLESGAGGATVQSTVA